MSRVKLLVRLLNAPEGGETAVAMAARLCYSGANIDALREKVSAADQNAFIQRLAEMGHLSPIEHASFTFGIEGVSRSLLAQITRHRLASFSVQSQRYVDQTKGGFSYILPPAVERLGPEYQARYEEQMQTIAAWYDEWVEALGGGKESAREDARFVLPNAAETKMMATMNARELLHFFSLRACSRAQWEIRALAWAMMGLCLAKAPALFAHCGPSCAFGACSEGKMSCGRAEEIRKKRADLAAFVEENKQAPDFEERMCAWAQQNA